MIRAFNSDRIQITWRQHLALSAKPFQSTWAFTFSYNPDSLEMVSNLLMNCCDGMRILPCSNGVLLESMPQRSVRFPMSKVLQGIFSILHRSLQKVMQDIWKRWCTSEMIWHAKCENNIAMCISQDLKNQAMPASSSNSYNSLLHSDLLYCQYFPVRLLVTNCKGFLFLGCYSLLYSICSYLKLRNCFRCESVYQFMKAFY